MAVLSNYIQKLPLPSASTSPTLPALPPPLTCGPATRSFLLASFASSSLLNTLARVISYVQVTSSHSVAERATKSHCGHRAPRGPTPCSQSLLCSLAHSAAARVSWLVPQNARYALLGAWALAVPSTWQALPADICLVDTSCPSILCSNVTFSMRHPSPYLQLQPPKPTSLNLLCFSVFIAFVPF